MIGRSAKWTVDRLVAHRIINDEDMEIYRFGLESVLLKAIHYVSMLFVGLLLGMLPETILFLITYAAIRAYAGGYHANTRGVCYVLSWVTILSVLLIARFSPVGITGVLAVAFIVLSFPVIFIFAPVENSAKPLDALECTHYKKRARITLMLLSSLGLILAFVLPGPLGLIMAECLALEAVMMLLGMWKNGH